MYLRTIHFLARHRNTSVIGTFCEGVLKILGLEIPKSVQLGKGIEFAHGARGLVVHPRTKIEDKVMIFQGVTLGRADAHVPFQRTKMQGILIKKGAVLCAGAKILCKEGTLIVGENTVVGANSVLFNSTGDNEIWAGIPAKKIRNRREDEF